VLAGRHDRLFPLEFMRRLARERLNIVADVIDTGHLPALSRRARLSEARSRGELDPVFPSQPREG
jgi:hypothetical protein